LTPGAAPTSLVEETVAAPERACKCVNQNEGAERRIWVPGCDGYGVGLGRYGCLSVCLSAIDFWQDSSWFPGQESAERRILISWQMDFLTDLMAHGFPD
jgi:hypothetical protein